MKILQILPALDTGGVERGTLEMVRAITAAGGQALVASAGGRLAPHVERAGGRHITLPLHRKNPLTIMLNARRLEKLIREEQISLVHARSRAPAWSAWRAARAASTPFITTWHGVYGEDFPGKHLYNAVMAKGERVIAISHYVASRITARYQVDQTRLRIIPRGVDTDLFDPARVGGDRVHRLAESWRIPAGARIVMLPARLTRWKGAEILLQAMARLTNRENLYCVLVGSDQGRENYAASLVSQSERLGFGPRLRLAGHVEDMPAAYRLADVVVSASLKPEPFGRVVIEAQAMGRPVVAFNHGGAAETIQNGLTGLLVPPGSAPHLAEAIARALDMPQASREELAWRTRTAIFQSYTTTAMQTATLNVYNEVLNP